MRIACIARIRYAADPVSVKHNADDLLVTTSLRLRDAQREWLDREAERKRRATGQNWTPSDVVRDLIDAARVKRP